MFNILKFDSFSDLFFFIPSLFAVVWLCAAAACWIAFEDGPLPSEANDY